MQKALADNADDVVVQFANRCLTSLMNTFIYPKGKE